MLTDPVALIGRFGAALAIGLLIGTQREFQHRREDNGAKSPYAGIRTFPLVALAGGMGAYLSGLFEGPWVMVAVVLVIGAMGLGAYRAGVARGDVGLTTEIALVVTGLAGALCIVGSLGVVVAIGVATTILLALKTETREFVAALNETEVEAALKFAAVSALVLPVLPNETYGPPPFDVVSPFKVWLMVVFISGISFLGYVLTKVVGAQRGVGLTGIVGGLASSTAVTLSFAERSKSQEALSGALAMGVLAAWAVMFARVLVEAAVVNRALLLEVWPAITAGGVAGLAYGVFLWWRSRQLDTGADEEHQTSFSNPFELKSALAFGALYAVILVGSKAAEMYLGTTGIYASAIASGLADVDAVTLSMAELSRPEGSLDLRTAATAVVLAAASNTVVKGGIVATTGSAAMRKAIVPGTALVLASMLAVQFFVT
ncbi:MAG: MgtC/SapB family protein [Rubricoccaceae bacterium]